MCGRYTQTKKPEDIKKLLPCTGDDSWLQPRYNIAPTQNAAVILPGRILSSMRWGLIPFWAKDPRIGNRMINARAETLAEKAAFKKLLEKRRCLVPADGFYEWQKSARQKQPFHFRLRSDAPFAFAGLWDHWQSPEGTMLESFTIITTEANDLLRTVHERMPVILAPQDHEVWLEAGPVPAQDLQKLLRPFPAEQMKSFPVSPKVNTPKYEAEDCIHPLPLPESLF